MFLLKGQDVLVNKLNLIAKAKKNFIDSQVKCLNLKNQSLFDAIIKVDRVNFFYNNLSNFAYCDTKINCNFNEKCLGKNSVVENNTETLAYTDALTNCNFVDRYSISFQSKAKMLDNLNLEKGQKALLIGDFCGYMSAILSLMELEVYLVESCKILFEKCIESLKNYPVKKILNLDFFTLSGYEPYDIIIIELGLNHIPDIIFENLNENGKIAACIVEENISNLVIYQKANGEIIKKFSTITSMPLSLEGKKELFEF